MLAIQSRHNNPPTHPQEQAQEWSRCHASPHYFLGAYCWIFNATEERWRTFDLWPAQGWALNRLLNHRQVVILKARQLGFTWLCLCYALWLMLFRAASTIGIFSRVETDAQELLDFRMKGVYRRLPSWMQAKSTEVDNMSRWVLSNGSIAMAFPTTGGRQYTFSYVLVDEADHQPDLNALMLSAKPTIDAGGKMTLLSSPDKGEPGSLFKQIYRHARSGTNEWTPLFLPWHARPGRTVEWYGAQKRDALANTGSLDSLHQEYPATDTEALAPRTLDKRIPAPWIEQCYTEMRPVAVDDAPAISGLVIYQAPEPGRHYCIGVDPAEGNPTSDDSALTVLDVETGEECAVLSGKFQPSVMAAHADRIGHYYNGASLMVERNNHGHAVLLWLNEHSRLRVLDGHDKKPGWLSSGLGKTLLYDALADCFRHGETTLHSFATYTQLASIEGATLRAPEGENDDRADSYALAHVGRLARPALPVPLIQASAKGWTRR